jgi:hypothetical protein
MPFTFKPETPQGVVPQAPPAASFGTASTASIAVRAKEGGKSIVQLILIAAFGISVLIALGLFIYSYYLSSQIESKKATLSSSEQRLGNIPLKDMRALSNRIKVVNQLVNEHPSVNTAFRIVEDSVENSVTYNRFDLHYSAAAKSYALIIGGLAPSYKAVAQQIDTLARDPYKAYVGTVTVEGLQPDPNGKIGFSLSMPIKVTLLPEDLNLSQGAAALVASTTPEESEPVETATGTKSQ